MTSTNEKLNFGTAMSLLNLWADNVRKFECLPDLGVQISHPITAKRDLSCIESAVNIVDDYLRVMNDINAIDSYTSVGLKEKYISHIEEIEDLVNSCRVKISKVRELIEDPNKN